VRAFASTGKAVYRCILHILCAGRRRSQGQRIGIAKITPRAKPASPKFPWHANESHKARGTPVNRITRWHMADEVRAIARACARVCTLDCNSANTFARAVAYYPCIQLFARVRMWVSREVNMRREICKWMQTVSQRNFSVTRERRFVAGWSILRYGSLSWIRWTRTMSFD
jgi:hypothetical protein